jgi:hypothetical protein
VSHAPTGGQKWTSGQYLYKCTVHTTWQYQQVTNIYQTHQLYDERLLLWLTTKCRFPRRHAGKFNIELTTSIPSALEHLECCNSISFTGIFNVHVPSQVRLTIAAHLELYHLAVLFKLRQNIFIKFPVIQSCYGLICTTNYVKSMFNPFRSYVEPRPTVWFSCSAPMLVDVRHGFFFFCSPAVGACPTLFLM